MVHSKYYERIKSYFPELWTREEVYNAVLKGLITLEEYNLIVG